MGKRPPHIIIKSSATHNNGRESSPLSGQLKVLLPSKINTGSRACVMYLSAEASMNVDEILHRNLSLTCERLFIIVSPAVRSVPQE